MAKEYLKQIGSTYGFRHGVLVHRTPVLYDPSTGTDVNHARLPPPDDYRDMELAYRLLPQDPVALARETSSQLLTIVLVSILVSVGAVVVGPFLPMSVGFYAAAFMGVMLGVAALFRTRLAPATIILLFVAPLLGLLLLKAFTVITAHRTVAALLFGAATVVLFYVHGSRPFTFYADWLYAHPRLKPETRAKDRDGSFGPNWRALVAILSIVLFVPMFSPTLAIITVIALAFFFQRRDLEFLARFHALVEILGTFISYGRYAIEAPGTWLPRQSSGRRCATLWLLAGSLFVTLAVGLDMFGPWDFVLWNLSERLPPVFVPDDIYGSPYAWIPPAVRLGHVWLLVTALVLLSIVPMFVLMALYTDPIRTLVALRQRIESDDPKAIDNDGRSEWQWYVDRLRWSPHVANDPLGEEVREAEHLFLGVGPNAEFPVLLDKSVLAEHCYIVGETGSGKTSRGITPLIIQLIRGHRNERGDRSAPPPIVILDLKAA